MNFESKIRWKAALLYAVIGLVIAGTSMLFYQMRTDINAEREKIAQERSSLHSLHGLINTVSRARSTSNRYISTRDRRYLLSFDSSVNQIRKISKQRMHKASASEVAQLKKIVGLLKQQSDNLRRLDKCIQRENPLKSLTQRLDAYHPPLAIETKSISTKQDTTVKVVKKKGFFRRVKEVFSPERDSTVIIRKEQVVHLKTADSLAILAEVKNIAHRAGTRYDDNLRSISSEMGYLMAADREIADKVSDLSTALYAGSFNEMFDRVAATEDTIERNYLYSLITGIVSLLLILLFIMLIIYDVNKAKEAREQIRMLMESRHQLLLAVSHDIKSPLHSIGGYLELQAQSEGKGAMQNAVRHISALLENLLEFSGLEQGTLTMTLHCIDAASICLEMEQMFKPMAQAKKLHLHCHADAVRLKVDYVKLKQIIINLLSNAVKYTRQGEVNLWLTYTDGLLTIRVSDTGVGIPQDQLPELFKPFTRVERNNTMAHGTGLGMYVVKGLVEMWGGTIDVQSQPNKGTHFTVTLPVEKQESTVPEGTKKIGLYDDDPVMLGVVRDMLTRLGHKVVESDYEIILTDMEMNELSGTDILASAGGIPVVVMTGRSDFNYERAREMGFSDFLSKPFNMDSLRMIFGEGNIPDDDFLGDDEEEIRAVFRESTAQNLDALREALTQHDYKKAQQLCHKMRPMFVLLGYPSDELTRMDTRRGSDYDGWTQDVEKILAIKV